MVKARSLGLVLLLVLLDQLTKALLTQKVALFPFFFLTPTTNTGAVFGLFQGYSSLFIVLGLVVLSFLSYMWWTHRRCSALEEWAYILVAAGIIGNLFDRVLLGYVRDFLDFRIWPVFNLADAFTVIGVVLFVFSERF